MAGAVIDRDLGMRRILRSIDLFDGIQATVGIQDDAGQADRDGISNAGLGAVHEFGVDRPELGIAIPERSWNRVPFDENLRTLERLILRGARRITAGRDSAERVVGVAGEFLRGKMVAAIDAGIEPENKPSTIRRKGSSKQLIDTAQMKQSITSVVSRGRSR